MPESKISIRPLDRFNWESALELELHDYQKDFLPDILFSIAQSKFENLFPFGILQEGKMVGFLMYGNFGGVCWVNRIMVDKAHQENGYGRQALQLLLKQLVRDPACHEIRTSFVRQNAIAEYFFQSEGFQKISDGLDDEIVMQYRSIKAD